MTTEDSVASSSKGKIVPLLPDADTSPPFHRRAKRIRTAGGPGKKGKIFSESLGLSHLLSLASTAGSTEEQRNSQRADRNRDSAQWKKKKRVEKANRVGKGASTGGQSPSAPPSSSSSSATSVAARTKAVIRADLKANRREKTKVRKEKRKLLAAEVQAYDSDDEDTKEARRKIKAQSQLLGPLKAQPAKKYKSVSFA